MVGTKLLQFQDRKTQWFEDEANALGSANHAEDSERAPVVERLVAGCLSYPGEMEMSWQHLRTAIVSGEATDYGEIGNFVKQLFARAIRMLTTVRSLGLDVAKATGHEPQGLDKLIDALAQLKSMQTRILADWPWPDEPLPAFDLVRMEAARQAIGRGKGLTIDHIIAQLGKEDTGKEGE